MDIDTYCVESSMSLPLLYQQVQNIQWENNWTTILCYDSISNTPVCCIWDSVTQNATTNNVCRYSNGHVHEHCLGTCPTIMEVYGHCTYDAAALGLERTIAPERHSWLLTLLFFGECASCMLLVGVLSNLRGNNQQMWKKIRGRGCCRVKVSKTTNTRLRQS